MIISYYKRIHEFMTNPKNFNKEKILFKARCAFLKDKGLLNRNIKCALANLSLYENKTDEKSLKIINSVNNIDKEILKQQITKSLKVNFPIDDLNRVVGYLIENTSPRSRCLIPNEEFYKYIKVMGLCDSLYTSTFGL